MNAKEAKEIVSNPNISKGPVYCRCDDHILLEKAETYLAALEGEEVKELCALLKEGLEWAIVALAEEQLWTKDFQSYVKRTREAVTKYQEAIKK